MGDPALSPPSTIQLIVGLANPGKEYAETRHNAGAWFVENLALDANVLLKRSAKFHGLYGLATLHDKPCHLLIPTTFMNLSGQAVRACMHYHKLSPDSILIAHDDIDLPAGTIKLKFDGGDGGHNGLSDIIRHLSTRQFYRLRIGVGHPGNSKDVVDYVLDKPSKADKQKIDLAIADGEAAVPLLLDGDIAKAMQALHTAKDK
jgi:peptidyl-tRNA hydrolase, PTH1 family